MHDSSLSFDRTRPDAIKQGPFSRAHNIYLFYGGGDRGQIVDALIRAIASRDNELMTVRGEPGSGKTMMSMVLADRMKHRRNIIRFDHDTTSTAALLRHLLLEISPRHADTVAAPEMSDDVSKEVVVPPSAPSTDLALQRLWQALQSPLPNDKPFLLIIDSDSTLDDAARALLGRLSKLQYQQRSTIQIVLFERDSTSRRIDSMEHSAYDFWLRRLTLPEIGDFLYHQMLCFDFNQRSLFTRDMAYFITERSEGVFSQIKELARQAMMFAEINGANGERSMMSEMLMARPQNDAEQLDSGQKFLSKHRRALIALMGLSVVVSIATGIALLG